MDYMFEAGFLGTRAPLFMDIIVIIVGLLPFLIAFSIWFAVKGMYRVHRLLQTVLFIVTIVTLVYFKYGMNIAGGFDFYMKGSSIDSTIAFYFLIFHIVIATITLIMWFATMRFASGDKRRKALPGLYSKDHKKSGKRLGFAIFLTSLTGIGVYCMLFIA
jgi:putative membrane protein